MQQSNDKVVLFEQTPIPKAVAQLAVPTVLSSLVMVLYNLADTFWVGMLNDPIQNAAVTLAAPVLLAFNAVNNLFGVGSSSMMSRALGRKDFDTVSRSSCLRFLLLGHLRRHLFFVMHCFPAAAAGAAGCGRFHIGGNPFLYVLDGQLRRSACHPQRGHGLSGPLGGRCHARKHRHNERLPAQHRP